MHNKPAPPAPPALTRISQQLLACVASGSMLGQVVVGLARQHDGALTGLVCALVFVLAGGASVVAFLQHLHASQHTSRQLRGTQAPTRAWLLALGAGVLGSIYAGSLLAA